MSEQGILERFAYYDQPADSIEDAIAKYEVKGWERIQDCSYNQTEHFTPEIVDRIMAMFDQNPYVCFTMLHNIAVKYPDRRDDLLGMYMEYMPKGGPAAVEQVYYIIANDKEMVTKELIDTMMECAHEKPFTIIMNLQMLMARRPDLLEKYHVEWVRDNLSAGANQAFYFMRDISTEYPLWAHICVQALFACVLTFHNNAYKQDFLRDIVNIAHKSHMKKEIADALQKPVDGGHIGARALMTFIFRQKNRRRQVLYIEMMDRILDWTYVWDFFVFLLENPVSIKDVSTHVAESFLDGSYRLSYLLSNRQYRELLHDRLDFTDIEPRPWSDDLAFLNRDGLPELRAKVETMAERVDDGTPELKCVASFVSRAEAMEKEIAALKAKIAEQEDEQRKEQMQQRLSNLEIRLATVDDVPESVRTKLWKDTDQELRTILAGLVSRMLKSLKQDAIREASKRILGYETDMWDVDEAVYPALFLVEKVSGYNYDYLKRLIEDKIKNEPSDWLWTEPPVEEWKENVKKAQPDVVLDNWRHEFKRSYTYKKKETEDEKDKRIKEELDDVRKRMRELEIEVEDGDGQPELLAKLQNANPENATAGQELKEDLERIRRYIRAPVSDFEGDVSLEIETDPFQYLFMGEYGFASCLSIQGTYFWSAVSNAIDVDKCIVWARDPYGNIIARRLLALVPSGMLSYRTYSNRQGLALQKYFNKFIREYAKHCRVNLTTKGKPGPLLSDEWYDDRPVRV